MIDKGRLMPRHGFLLWAALFVLAWLGATYLVHFVLDRTYTVTHIFFQKQDCYVLIAAVPFLAFLAWPRFTARDLPGGPSEALVYGYLVLAVIVTWAGHYLFSVYSMRFRSVYVVFVVVRSVMPCCRFWLFDHGLDLRVTIFLEDRLLRLAVVIGRVL